MTGKRFCCALACWLGTWAAIRADGYPPSGLIQVQAPPQQPAPAQPNPVAAAPLPPPPSLEEGEAPERTNPHMIGDLPGLFGLRTFSVSAIQTISTTQPVTQTQQVTVTFRDQDGVLHTVRVPVTTTVQVPVQQQRIVEVPVNLRVAFPSRGEFNIAEGESPRPEDRVFFNYNFYSNVTGPDTLSALPHLDTTTTTINGRPATVTTLTPGVGPPSLDLHREVIGFEKTFLGGDASVELRAPVVEQIGADAIGGSDFGDITVVLKYAFLNNRTTGDVLAAGLALTLPTGPGLPLLGGGDLHSTLIQPWFGYLWNFDRFYVEGFSSLVVPTDARDVTLFFNDVSVGYMLYQAGGDRIISAVIPTIEAHVTTPLNHRNDTSLITFPDLVVLTAGSHIDIGRSATLTVGVAAPVTGPRPFDVEALVQFSYRF